MAEITPDGGTHSVDSTLGLSGNSIESFLNNSNGSVTDFGVLTKSFTSRTQRQRLERYERAIPWHPDPGQLRLDCLGDDELCDFDGRHLPVGIRVLQLG